MDEQEEIIRITVDDVAEANRLSLNCPICASAVEKYVDRPEMAPVYCSGCETLYHLVCFEQNGGSCAVLGCESTSYTKYHAVDLEPALTIERRDIPRESIRPVVSPNGRTRRLKQEEKRRQRQRGGFWQLLWESLLRAIKIWPSDPS